MKKKGRPPTFAFVRWGGKRKGAGRKPNGERAGVSHRSRAPFARRFPVHVTVRLKKGLPSLRRKRAWRVLWNAWRHGIRFVAGVDPFTSADSGSVRLPGPRTWLLRRGWRRARSPA